MMKKLKRSQIFGNSQRIITLLTLASAEELLSKEGKCDLPNTI